METFSSRFQKALELRNMKQADIVEKTGIGKSSISTYLNGEYEPKQRNIYKIAKALDVSEAWLMGYTDNMERQDKTAHTNSQSTDLSEQIKKAYGEEPYEALQAFSRLDTADRAEIRGEMKQMLKADKYAAKKGFSNGQAM